MPIIFSTLLSIVLVGIIVFFIYTKRWNIIYPLKEHTLVIDNVRRKFLYHLPKKLKARPKLIIAFHGTGMTASLMQVFTGHEFDLLANKSEDTIIVYPQGYKKNWNDCRKQAPYPAKTLNINDVEFTKQLISYFITKYKIDQSAVYAIGLSNGGQMVFKLAKETPHLFKGFAAISANLPVIENDSCKNMNEPVSMFYMSGTNDPISPYNGGEIHLQGKSFGSVLSSPDTLQYWLGVSGCINSRKRITNYPDQGSESAVQYDYISDITGKKIRFVKVINGGHTLPTKNFRITFKMSGAMNKDIDAPKMIWDFFMDL